MEFTVTKADLVRELNLSQGVVEKRTTIPILSNVLIEASGDRVQLTATDLELGIRVSCPARVTREGSGTVPVRRLLDYVRLLPDAEVGVKFLENHWASLTCGRSRTRIAGISRESFPELPAMPEPLAEIPVGVLASMISRTIFAISAEESRFTLNGALLQLKLNTLLMVATDGHRLAHVESCAELPGISAPYRALLPRKAMSEILKLAQEAGPDAVVKFAGDENHLFFELGDRLLISRKLTGTFPDYERVLPKDHKVSVTLKRDEIRAAVERVAQFADERSKAIRMQMCPGEVKVHSSISETGESEESVPVEYDGPSIDIGFNAQYLLDFLRVTAEAEVEFCFKDPHSAAEVRPGGAGDGYAYRYVVMPMRI
ncbi:MAG TPA: DNA polymerase III subunit beta [Bryobacteraceae bacterium]|nr:DNA polymerase III subunit beta [Bryobacteraceae bacterium]